jgi:hypothetical protein
MGWFTIGFFVGLLAGVWLWLPETLLIANIMIGLLHMPGDMSAGSSVLFSLALYAIWLLIIFAIVPLVGRLTREAPVVSAHAPPAPPRAAPFFRGLLCSSPLPTILINYLWQTSGVH